MKKFIENIIIDIDSNYLDWIYRTIFLSLAMRLMEGDIYMSVLMIVLCAILMYGDYCEAINFVDYQKEWL